jgi:hypothetical protein
MPKACFEISNDISARVRLVRDQLTAETGGSYSMDSTIRHLVLIGLDVLAKKPERISMLFAPATKKARARVVSTSPPCGLDNEKKCG